MVTNIQKQYNNLENQIKNLYILKFSIIQILLDK